MSRRTRADFRAIVPILPILMVLTLVLSACSSSPTSTTKGTPTTQSARLKFVIVAASQMTDPFWALVKRGADKAASDLGVTVTYQAPGSGGASALSQLIDDAVTTQPDGLVLSIPDCAGLTPAIQRAQLVSISVIAIASGSACASKLGLFSYIGQIDYQAGLQGGQQLARAGARHVLCVNQDTKNATMNDRCRGVSDALRKVGGRSDVLAIDLSDPISAQQKIQATLTADPSIAAVITLDSASAALAIAASQQIVRASQFSLATFDLSATVLQAIQQGNMLFAIDQQPYLQGYLSIVWLTLYKKNAATVANPIISTGPTFVTSANIVQIQQLEAAGVR